jgi:hypothetical protein
MLDIEKEWKYEALFRYMGNYDDENLKLLSFPKEDKKYLMDACGKQVSKEVKQNRNILYCPICERHARRKYDLYCSGCGQKLGYQENEINE